MPRSTALRAPARSETLLVPERFAVPGSFIEALKEGWTIARETTVLAVDKRHRHGTVILVKKGREQRLAVPYTASVKLGYRYSKPELL
jgi:hypothetical protein